MPIDPSLCPRCQADNACGNLNPSDNNADCWCQAGEITFPAGLLEKIADEHRNKACICQRCAAEYIATEPL